MNNVAADPADLLQDLETIRARSRRLAHGGAWLPALVLAALPLLSIALYRHPFSTAWMAAPQSPPSADLLEAGHPYWAGLPDLQRDSLLSYAFWLVAEPLAFTVVALWYRRRERSHGVRLAWRAPVAAGSAGLLCLLALLAAPTGAAAVVGRGVQSPWHGLLTPLLTVGVAAIVLGFIERSPGIALAGTWLALLTWQFCATGQIGGLLGWQAWLLSGGSGPALGGQITLLGLDCPAPALLAAALPLALVAGYRAARARGHSA